MTDLKSFVQSQLALKQASQHVDWSKRKEKWLLELGRLFGFIRVSLHEAGLSEDQIVDVQHALHEDTLGFYDAPGLVVQLPAGGRVNFKPVASVVVGGYGRVDVTGPATRERVKLIADDADEDRPDGDETPSYERD
jgi:hypothetical protein